MTCGNKSFYCLYHNFHRYFHNDMIFNFEKRFSESFLKKISNQFSEQYDFITFNRFNRFNRYNPSSSSISSSLFNSSRQFHSLNKLNQHHTNINSKNNTSFINEYDLDQNYLQFSKKQFHSFYNNLDFNKRVKLIQLFLLQSHSDFQKESKSYKSRELSFDKYFEWMRIFSERVGVTLPSNIEKMSSTSKNMIGFNVDSIDTIKSLDSTSSTNSISSISSISSIDSIDSKIDSDASIANFINEWRTAWLFHQSNANTNSKPSSNSETNTLTNIRPRDIILQFMDNHDFSSPISRDTLYSIHRITGLSPGNIKSFIKFSKDKKGVLTERKKNIILEYLNDLVSNFTENNLEKEYSFSSFNQNTINLNETDTINKTNTIVSLDLNLKLKLKDKLTKEHIHEIQVLTNLSKNQIRKQIYRLLDPPKEITTNKKLELESYLKTNNIEKYNDLSQEQKHELRIKLNISLEQLKQLATQILDHINSLDDINDKIKEEIIQWIRDNKSNRKLADSEFIDQIQFHFAPKISRKILSRFIKYHFHSDKRITLEIKELMLKYLRQNEMKPLNGEILSLLVEKTGLDYNRLHQLMISQLNKPMKISKDKKLEIIKCIESKMGNSSISNVNIEKNRELLNYLSNHFNIPYNQARSFLRSYLDPPKEMNNEKKEKIIQWLKNNKNNNHQLTKDEYKFIAKECDLSLMQIYKLVKYLQKKENI